MIVAVCLAVVKMSLVLSCTILYIIFLYMYLMCSEDSDARSLFSALLLNGYCHKLYCHFHEF